MTGTVVRLEMQDTLVDQDAVALFVPLGIDTEFQRAVSFRAPQGWAVEIVADAGTGQRAAVMVPPAPDAIASLEYVFAEGGPGLTDDAFRPIPCPLTTAADELATEARDMAVAERDGRAGIAAIVEATAMRFTYGKVPEEDRWYHARDTVPTVACASGNCIDINTFLVAALRAAGYEATYLTCQFIPDQPGPAAPGMHCWVRTRCEGMVEDWDIAHFKKAGDPAVRAMLNPIPGTRWALAYGRSHRYPSRITGRALEVRVSTPSDPMWVRADGKALWPRVDPLVTQTALGSGEAEAG